MQPLTLDDLLPLAEFANQRRELFARHQQYLDRYRRVRVGPRATVQFENRQTLWFRAQEISHVARLSEPELLQRQLDLLNRLLPPADTLQASLLIDIVDAARMTEELAAWHDLSGGHLRLQLGTVECPANVLTSRPEDRCIGAAHWIQFPLMPTLKALLRQSRAAPRLATFLQRYRHVSEPFSEEIVQSLRDDLDFGRRAA